MRYWPALSVTVVRTFSISAGLDASTVTPGSTAPDPSLTTPAIDPCAKTAAGRKQTATTTTKRKQVRITRSPVVRGHGVRHFGTRTKISQTGWRLVLRFGAQVTC